MLIIFDFFQVLMLLFLCFFFSYALLSLIEIFSFDNKPVEYKKLSVGVICFLVSYDAVPFRASSFRL